MLRQFIFIICLLSLFTCVHAKHTSQVLVQNPKSQTTVGSYTHVYVQGDVDVILHTGSIHPQVILRGDPRDLASVVWSVNDGILRINEGKGFPKFGRVQVELSMQHLSTFSYHGSGNIMGRNLHSNGLDVIIVNNGKAHLDGYIVLRTLKVKGKGFTEINGINSRQLQVKLAGSARVQLSGVANVANVDIQGTAWFSLYWVKSKLLMIRVKDAGFIQMAGIAKMLDVELWGKSRFNGRYLRATRSFVKTHDHSQADIAIVKRQHTLATDASNIYFYHLPQMKADFMAVNGSVLDMREWELPSLKEPTHYNLGPT